MYTLKKQQRFRKQGSYSEVDTGGERNGYHARQSLADLQAGVSASLFADTAGSLSHLLETSEHILGIPAVFVFRIYSTHETDIKKNKSTCKRKRRHIIYNLLFFICCE